MGPIEPGGPIAEEIRRQKMIREVKRRHRLFGESLGMMLSMRMRSGAFLWLDKFIKLP